VYRRVFLLHVLVYVQGGGLNLAISVKTDFVIASPEFNPIDKLRRITV
jgi:hypothetical protein